ncbi:hypothetical protein [Bradyrhizobium stylosanthis]|uniref:hypothetical protein n=1 Tax=Bradyrhizobium stylosanthis TaxID=1803665 RepID=UPI000A9D8B79|nr:hypothetical protein [Bradyrhizobium stylosanthis]
MSAEDARCQPRRLLDRLAANTRINNRMPAGLARKSGHFGNAIASPKMDLGASVRAAAIMYSRTSL